MTVSVGGHVQVFKGSYVRAVHFLSCELSPFLSSNCQGGESENRPSSWGVVQPPWGSKGWKGFLKDTACHASDCPDGSLIRGHPALSRTQGCQGPSGLKELYRNLQVCAGRRDAGPLLS